MLFKSTLLVLFAILAMASSKPTPRMARLHDARKLQDEPQSNSIDDPLTKDSSSIEFGWLQDVENYFLAKNSMTYTDQHDDTYIQDDGAYGPYIDDLSFTEYRCQCVAISSESADDSKNQDESDNRRRKLTMTRKVQRPNGKRKLPALSSLDNTDDTAEETATLPHPHPHPKGPIKTPPSSTNGGGSTDDEAAILRSGSPETDDEEGEEGEEGDTKDTEDTSPNTNNTVETHEKTSSQDTKHNESSFMQTVINNLSENILAASAIILVPTVVVAGVFVYRGLSQTPRQLVPQSEAELNHDSTHSQHADDERGSKTHSRSSSAPLVSLPEAVMV